VKKIKVVLAGLLVIVGTLLVAGCSALADVPAPTASEEKTIPSEMHEADAVIEPEIEAYLQAHRAAGQFMGSVLVAQGDHVLHSAGYGMADLEHNVANTSHTKYRLSSLTKQFTAAAILNLQDQGLLDVDDPISAYLPDYPNGDVITIHHLLSHSSGIPDLENFPDFVATMREPATPSELIERFADMPLEFEPGDQWAYSSSNYIVLANIIEEVARQSYAEYLDTVLFAPLGMTNTGHDVFETILESRANGYTMGEDGYQNAAFIDMSIAVGGGSLYSTVLDLYTWTQALLKDAVLSDEARELLFTPAMEIGDGNAYGYGWIIGNEWGRRVISHSGGINGSSTYLTLIPEEELIVIVLSNLEGLPLEGIARDLDAIVLGESYEAPVIRTAIELDPAILERYVGRYEGESGLVFTIIFEDGQLYAQPLEQPRVAIYPESETDFFLTVVDAQLRFLMNENDEATGFIIFQDGQQIEVPKVD
jgi:CubicO group peptidase (beta-lactamase class C family)